MLLGGCHGVWLAVERGFNYVTRQMYMQQGGNGSHATQMMHSTCSAAFVSVAQPQISLKFCCSAASVCFVHIAPAPRIPNEQAARLLMQVLCLVPNHPRSGTSVCDGHAKPGWLCAVDNFILGGHAYFALLISDKCVCSKGFPPAPFASAKSQCGLLCQTYCASTMWHVLHGLAEGLSARMRQVCVDKSAGWP